jgi:exosortase
MSTQPVSNEPLKRSRSAVVVEVFLLGAVLLWSTWPVWCQMGRRWAHDPRYSHGYLVPLFSLYLLWHRRGMLGTEPLRPSAWGLLSIVAGESLLLLGTFYHIVWFQSVSLIFLLAGCSMLLGGWRALRWSWVSVAFLIFMMPLPYRLETALAGPLQSVATNVSTYVLQTLGISALAEGNVIQLNEVRLGVVEACSGLSMLLTFFAIATAVALLVNRRIGEKVVLVLSAIPIAVIANVARITLTGALHETVGKRTADAVYHDLAGWLMMPLALTLLWVELRCFSKLLIETEQPATFPDRIAQGPVAASRVQGDSRERPPGPRVSSPRV